MKVKILQPMLEPGKLFDFKKDKTLLKSATTYDASNDYAVIISGGMDNHNNWYRYWNDCSAIYSALVDVYNYSPSHIYVLMSDGTSSGNDRLLGYQTDIYGNVIGYIMDSSPLDLDGNGTNDINYSATKSNISTVFNTLSGILSSDDHLFVFTTDHGGQESGDDVYMNLWGETIRDDQFADELDKVHAGKITVTMEQCNSGGFVDDLEANGRVISTACAAGESSWPMANNTYDEFVYYWISAIAGETPEGTTVDADDNNDGWVSMREAFDYANDNDNAHINGVYWQGNTYFETPQYNSTPADLGCFVRLSDNWNWSLTGPSIICSNGTFIVNEVPTGATINWDDCSTTLSPPSSSTANPGVFSKNSNGSGWIAVSISNGCGTIDLPQKTVWVGPPVINTIVGEQYLPTGGTSSYLATTEGAISATYQWSVSPSRPITNQGNKKVFITFPATNGDYVITLIVTNTCGTSEPYYYYVSTGEYEPDIIFPNPTSGETTVSLESVIQSKAPDETAEWELKIYDNAQMLKEKKTKLKGNNTKIQTAGWKEGMYVVRVKYKNQILTGKLVVKK
jgi:hypothetical protein